MLYESCRQPDFGDYVVFYGADIGQVYIRNQLNKLANQGRLGSGEFWLGFWANILLGALKTSVNQELCRPLPSLYSETQAKPRRIKAKGTLTLK